MSLKNDTKQWIYHTNVVTIPNKVLDYNELHCYTIFFGGKSNNVAHQHKCSCFLSLNSGFTIKQFPGYTTFPDTPPAPSLELAVGIWSKFIYPSLFLVTKQLLSLFFDDHRFEPLINMYDNPIGKQCRYAMYQPRTMNDPYQMDLPNGELVLDSAHSRFCLKLDKSLEVSVVWWVK